MRIDLPQSYQAIETLTTVDLPDFALLIGRNGAGKTQLIEALRQGAARIRRWYCLPSSQAHQTVLYCELRRLLGD